MKLEELQKNDAQLLLRFNELQNEEKYLDARRITAEIARNKRFSAATLEQRKQVAELVAKLEMQRTNTSAEVSSRLAPFFVLQLLTLLLFLNKIV